MGSGEISEERRGADVGRSRRKRSAARGWIAPFLGQTAAFAARRLRDSLGPLSREPTVGEPASTAAQRDTPSRRSPASETAKRADEATVPSHRRRPDLWIPAAYALFSST